MKKFDSPVEAIEFFKSQKGNSELSIGKTTDKNLQYRNAVATMKDGKVDYVAKDFQKDYYSPELTHSFYVDKGAGYAINQGSKMLQGRSAYREDLVNRAGEQYKAWSQFQFDKPKYKYGNFQVKQFSEGYATMYKKPCRSTRSNWNQVLKKKPKLLPS